MGSIFDVEEDMWNVPITPYLLVDVLGFSIRRVDDDFNHVINLSKKRIGVFGLEPVRVFKWGEIWFICMHNAYSWSNVCINKELGYPKRVDTIRELVDELQKIYTILESAGDFRIPNKIQV